MLLAQNETASDSVHVVRHALESMPAEFDSIADLEDRRLGRPSGPTENARASAEQIPLERLFEAYNEFAIISLPSPDLEDAVWEVVLAIHARNYLTPEQYTLLVDPWEAEFGPIEAPMQTRTYSMRRKF